MGSLKVLSATLQNHIAECLISQSTKDFDTCSIKSSNLRYHIKLPLSDVEHILTVPTGQLQWTECLAMNACADGLML